MKLALLFLCCLFISCHKEPEEWKDPNSRKVYNGACKMERNGHDWKALPTAYIHPEKWFYSLSFDSLANGFLVRSLYFSKIPLYQFDTIHGFIGISSSITTPSVTFSYQEADLTLEKWEPLAADSINTWLKIDQFDTVSRVVEGSFSATLIKREGGLTLKAPDTFRFRNGTFSTKLMDR